MKKRKLFGIVSSVLLTFSILVPSSVFAQSGGYNENPSVQDIGTKLRSESLADVKASNRLILSDSADSGSGMGSQ